MENLQNNVFYCHYKLGIYYHATMIFVEFNKISYNLSFVMFFIVIHTHGKKKWSSILIYFIVYIIYFQLLQKFRVISIF